MIQKNLHMYHRSLVISPTKFENFFRAYPRNPLKQINALVSKTFSYLETRRFLKHILRNLLRTTQTGIDLCNKKEGNKSCKILQDLIPRCIALYYYAKAGISYVRKSYRICIHSSCFLTFCCEDRSLLPF